MNLLFTTIVPLSSLPSWWWTKGPGLGDPPLVSTRDRAIVAGLTLAGGVGAASIFGRSALSMSVAAFAGGLIGGRVAAATLNPQPLPPRA